MLEAMWNRFMRKPLVGDWASPSTNYLRFEIHYSGTVASQNWGNGNNEVTVSPSPGWTVNEWAGKYFEATSGTGEGDEIVILSNTADTLTIDGTFSHDHTAQTFRIDDGGDPTTIQSTGFIDIFYYDIPSLYIATVEIEYKHKALVTNGYAGAWIWYVNGQFGELATTQNATPSHKYTALNYNRHLERTRRVFINFPVIQNSRSAVGDQDKLRFAVQGSGINSDEINQWEITNIRARLIYVPL